jgi:Sec-independent protein translocase protein TatA
MSFSGMLFLAFLALIVFGPKKLPHVAKQIGRMLTELKSVTSGFGSQLEIQMEVGGKQEETAPVSLMLPAETRPGVLDKDTSRDEQGAGRGFPWLIGLRPHWLKTWTPCRSLRIWRS